MALNLAPRLGARGLRVVSRPPSASTAAGSSKMHALEQQTLVEQAFAR
jgi:2-oxoglutarate dehydrogenase E1 component